MATSALAVQNWFETTLSGGINASDTDIGLNSVPTGTEGYLIIEPDGTTTREVIYYTSKTSNSVVLTSAANGRGVDGTTAQSHSAGATVRMQITSGYWNALQDGTALAADSIDTPNIKDGAVTGPKIAAGAITLGYAQITSNFTTSSTSATQVTGLTSTVTIPSGGRRVRVTAWCRSISNTTANTVQLLSIWDGAVGSGTQISEATSTQVAGVTNFEQQTQAVAVVSPASGSKTYNVSLHVTGGGASLKAHTTFPAFILVEAI